MAATEAQDMSSAVTVLCQQCAACVLELLGCQGASQKQFVTHLVV